VPAFVGKRQTYIVRAINLSALVARSGKPSDAKARKCPRCRQVTLEYTARVAVLTQSIAKKKEKKSGVSDAKDRLSYEPAWLCKNVACKYLRWIDL